MKLGVVGLLPSWEKIDVEAARRVRAAGFCGASIFFNRPLETDLAAVGKLKAALDEAGLAVAQANGWYEVLVNPDEGLRAEGIRGVQALCRIGRILDAPSVYVRPGSLNPHGAWYPHPGNFTAEVFDRLVDSLKKACRAAQEEGELLGLEGHVLSMLDTPRRVRDVLDAVGSPMLKFNIDAVNFFGTVHDVYEPRRVLNELVDLLGKDTIAGHMKDCALRDELVIHVDEVVIGEGNMDYDYLLPRMEQVCPDVYCIIEHLPDEKIPQARAGLLRAAERVGVKFEM
jgi:sugar phosphate isomerase/epimerase